MPVTARLSRRFYDQFGYKTARERVDGFNGDSWQHAFAMTYTILTSIGSDRAPGPPG